ncbi:hypothetical protein [Agrobacterium tumefaciens]|uniref:hypothetical protein n=1 Tax=Agrobacterium tumefaciens TaxID=358 RepID=UPI0015746A3D|nr:hypothetical protein [Agrobacterium tumefaciens]
MTINPAFALALSANGTQGNEFLKVVECDFHRLLDHADKGDSISIESHPILNCTMASGF